MDKGLTKQEDIQVRTAFADLMEKHAKLFSAEEEEMVRRAFALAVDSHLGMRRISGEPYVAHSISVARIVVEEMNLDAVSVVCALLHDVTKYTSIDLAEIDSAFDSKIQSVIKGLNKIEGLYTQRVSLHADSFIKLLLNLSSDVRIILIKLADRLDNMRTLEVVEPEIRKKVALETQLLYAPIAHRLGLYRIKTELEELSMKFSEPEIYRSIDSNLEQNRDELQDYIKSFINPIETELKKQGLKFEIKGRLKSISSIWKKMRKQQVEFSEVYDLFAIRIILDSIDEREKDECWRVYSIIANLYQPNPKRLRDWISAPKNNGYESLHTTVIGPKGRWVEVQIRSKRMDIIAEKGHAAHWKYKGGKAEGVKTSWLEEIRSILETPDVQSQRIDEAKGELYSSKIFVFTPLGDIKNLSEGATVLDFAYSVHSKVGDTCTGAKVNGKIVPIKHKLSNGDQIEILTSKNQHPKQDWLNIVSSPRAKAKIKRALKDIEYSQSVLGRDLIKYKLSQLKVEFSDAVIRKIYKHYNFENQHELYHAFATNRIQPSDIKDILNDTLKPVKEPPPVVLPKKKQEQHVLAADNLLLIDNDPEIRDFRMASCCNPLPGDPVFAFITVNKGITVHRNSCPNASQMRAHYSYRILPAQWGGSDLLDDVIVKLKLSGSDQLGMLNTLSGVIANDVKTNIKAINIQSKSDRFEGVIELFIKDKNHLDLVIQKIKKIKGIEKVIRL